MKLKEYNKKRNFDKTFEPEGKLEYSQEGLRFVVHHHLATRDHFDLRLEWGGVLLSWAVPKGPSYNTRDKRLAVHVEDHPMDYRNFEGTIPKGEYGGGTVMLWDEGFWEPKVNVEEGLRDGMLKFVLKGRRLKGKWALVRLKGKEDSKADNWLFLKERDEYVQTSHGISEFNTSIRSGRTMEEIEKGEDEKIHKNPFTTTEVQLAKMVTSIPKGDNWLYELKYDGYRILAYIEGSSVSLVTRNSNDFTGRFSSISSVLADWAEGRSMVLDGEIVITDERGKTDFQVLQSYMKNPRGHNLTYIVFDILALDGKDLRGLALTERIQILEDLMNDSPNGLYHSPSVKGYGKESFAAACQADMEGIMGKKADSIYSGTRNGDWIKLKCDKREEFVIGGYSMSEKRTWGISSLLLGIYEGEDLSYIGRAGTGISESEMKILLEKFENLKREDSPFKIAPKAKSNERLTWLDPELVAEIKFAELTKDNLLRQASYKGLRIDKNPKDVVKENEEDRRLFESSNKARALEKEETPKIVKTQQREKTKGLIIEGIKISNPDKIIYDDLEITKADVVRYYEKVSDRMLPYVRNRILSMVRCPKGVGGTCFYKKHPAASSKGTVTIPIINNKGQWEDYFYIDSKEGLISEAQMGSLEFHTWGSNIEYLDNPDIMVFDLDPDEGMDLTRVRQGVLDIKDILAELSLKSYLKTSGGKGYHILVPLQPSATWDAFYEFSKLVAVVMERKWPDRYTSNIRKASRKGRIFIDWIRNGRGATSIAPYSLRARKGAKVSMPISWDELDTLAPDGINMWDALQRIERDDPWGDFFQNDQRLK